DHPCGRDVRPDDRVQGDRLPLVVALAAPVDPAGEHWQVVGRGRLQGKGVGRAAAEQVADVGEVRDDRGTERLVHAARVIARDRPGERAVRALQGVAGLVAALVAAVLGISASTLTREVALRARLAGTPTGRGAGWGRAGR